MDLRSLDFGVWRFAVRAMRIGAGLAVAFLVIVFGVSNSIDLLSSPFSELSPLSLLGGIVLAILSLLGLLFALGIAIGEGPSPPLSPHIVNTRR